MPLRHVRDNVLLTTDAPPTEYWLLVCMVHDVLQTVWACTHGGRLPVRPDTNPPPPPPLWAPQPILVSIWLELAI